MVRAWLAGVWLVGGIAQAQSYQWALGPSLPQPVQEIYPTVSDDRILVAGGLYLGEDGALLMTNRVWALTAGAEHWQSLPNLPQARHHAMLVGTGDGTFAFGGFVESAEGQWTNTNSVLFLGHNGAAWISREAIPVMLSETVSAVLKDGIHLAGGRTATPSKNGQWLDNTDTDWHGVFNPQSGIWTTAPPLPTPRNSACSTVLNGNWHVIGGRTVAEGNVPTHEMFNPATRKWQALPPLPQAQAGLTCSAYQGNIYVFGGEYFTGDGGVFMEVWRYSPRKKSWQEVSTMPLPRHGLGSVVKDDKIWLIGGAAEAGAKDTRNTVSQFFLPSPVKQ
ncbi:galactose oxidase [Alteromonas sp. ASW11-19]|uniref:Galactose oxidase n=1 Tax=Alteromonas salexigens TaxID=2982530 RepID=A0ABT2VLU1_9ALTE|nr:kelch repeat-containing protein [Alteromonas salexigens]MCU7554283.1 galactose oxidase [Alteromonas salexigens]